MDISTDVKSRLEAFNIHGSSRGIFIENNMCNMRCCSSLGLLSDRARIISTALGMSSSRSSSRSQGISSLRCTSGRPFSGRFGLPTASVLGALFPSCSGRSEPAPISPPFRATQVRTADLLVRDAEHTRSHVQKSCALLSREPCFGCWRHPDPPMHARSVEPPRHIRRCMDESARRGAR